MTVDWSSLVTAIQTQITSVVPEILPVAGLILSVFVGWNIIRRFVR